MYSIPYTRVKGKDQSMVQLNLHETDLFDMALFVDLWFFPRFYQFLFVVIIKLFFTDMKIKTKTT